MCDSNSAFLSLLDILYVFTENSPAVETSSRRLKEADGTSIVELKTVKTNI